MKIKELLKVEPSTILVICGQEREIVEIKDYQAKTSSWTNLVSLAETGREVVLEIVDGEARLYLQMKELPLNIIGMKSITDVDVKTIFHEGRKFEQDELSRAKTLSRTKEGSKSGKLRFAVFIPLDDDESDELVAVEEEEGQLISYHSMGLIPLREIQFK